MRSSQHRDARVRLPTMYGLIREYQQVKLIQDFEFLSFSPSVIHEVAQYLVLSSLNNVHFPFRLLYRADGKSASERVVYDSIQKPSVPLSPSNYFSVATVSITVEETNDLLRKVGFSTVDRPVFSMDRIHAMKILFSSTPKFHSTWIRDGQQHVLFENGVLVHPLL